MRSWSIILLKTVSTIKYSITTHNFRYLHKSGLHILISKSQWQKNKSLMLICSFSKKKKLWFKSNQYQLVTHKLVINRKLQWGGCSPHEGILLDKPLRAGLRNPDAHACYPILYSTQFLRIVRSGCRHRFQGSRTFCESGHQVPRTWRSAEGISVDASGDLGSGASEVWSIKENVAAGNPVPVLPAPESGSIVIDAFCHLGFKTPSDQNNIPVRLKTTNQDLGHSTSNCLIKWVERNQK